MPTYQFDYDFRHKVERREIFARDAADSLFLFGHNFAAFHSTADTRVPSARITCVSSDDFNAGRLAERTDCLTSIQAAIKPGVSSGNGCDELAERNGLVTAANIVASRFNKRT